MLILLGIFIPFPFHSSDLPHAVVVFCCHISKAEYTELG